MGKLDQMPHWCRRWTTLEMVMVVVMATKWYIPPQLCLRSWTTLLVMHNLHLRQHHSLLLPCWFGHHHFLLQL